MLKVDAWRQRERGDGREPAYEPPLKPAVRVPPEMLSFRKGGYPEWIPNPGITPAREAPPETPDDFEFA